MNAKGMTDVPRPSRHCQSIVPDRSQQRRWAIMCMTPSVRVDGSLHTEAVHQWSDLDQSSSVGRVKRCPVLNPPDHRRQRRSDHLKHSGRVNGYVGLSGIDEIEGPLGPDEEMEEPRVQDGDVVERKRTLRVRQVALR